MTIMDAMAECLAGMTNDDVSPKARRKIEACLTAAISASPAGVKTDRQQDIEDIHKLAAMVGATFKPYERAGVGVETPADKQWHLARVEEEIKAGRSQNAISYVSFAIADAEAAMRRNCQYLLDILDGQGFEERDLSEEDEDAINGIRATLKGDEQ